MSIKTDRSVINVAPSLNFFDPILGQFVKAKDLDENNHLVGMNFEIYRIKKVKFIQGNFDAFDIFVKKNHLFFINDFGGRSLLVSNKSLSGMSFGEVFSGGIFGLTSGVSGAASAAISSKVGFCAAVGSKLKYFWSNVTKEGFVLGFLVTTVVGGGIYLFTRKNEPEISYYKMFGIRKEASIIEINERYERFILYFRANEYDSRIIKCFKEGYRVLLNEKSRKEYDKFFSKNKCERMHKELNKETLKLIDDFKKQIMEKILARDY